ITGNENDAGALAGLAQQLLQNVVVALWPVRSAANFPKIDDVADEIEHLALDGFEKIEKGRSLAIAHSEVDIGNEDCAVVQLRVRCAQFSPQSQCTSCDGKDRIHVTGV